MVKPSRGMQPENVALDKAGRSAGKSFQDGGDQFQNYMARKIDLQRKQFGLVVPPPPLPQPLEPTVGSHEKSCSNVEEKQLKKPSVRFASDVVEKDRPSKRKRSEMGKLLKRLKRKHGRIRRNRRKHSQESQEEGTGEDVVRSGEIYRDEVEMPTAGTSESLAQHNQMEISESQPSHAKASISKSRTDLFFTGVVVLVNGYTNPDTETLQRLLHKHGGDLERYETTRVTHIIAEHLSKAKANLYKNRRKPVPVCYPSWIVDCVKAMKLLPCGKYLIDEVRDDSTLAPSIASFFAPKSQAASPDADQPEKNAGNKLASDSRDASCNVTLDVVSEVDMALKLDAMELREESQPEIAPRNSRIITNDKEQTNSESLALEIYSLDGKTSETSPSFTKPRESATRIAPSHSWEGIDTMNKDNNERYINGRVRTVGTDPNFLDSFFSASRLSFIGSYKQRAKQSPRKKTATGKRHQRFIFHIDMDCFFAAVVLRNYPEYRDQPVAISHNGGEATLPENGLPNKTKDSTSECATCNYVARSYGIKKGMYLGRAKELCPHLVVLKYDFTGYEEVSEQVVDIISHYAHEYGGNVEQVSCDEAYLELYIEEQDSLNPDSLVQSIAESIRIEIFESTECTASVGVASNKFLAKLASDRVKPNASFVVQSHKELMKELKLRDLHGIGYRLDRKLENEGLEYVQDVWDLGERGEQELCRILGTATGKKIYQFCNGIDERLVEPAPRKTIGAECNYGVRFNGPYGVDHMIAGLAKEVEKRMNHVGMVGSKVTLKLKQRKAGAPPPPKYLGHGSCHNLSKSCDLPGGRPTRESDLISKSCMGMYQKMNVQKDDIRGMGIVVSKLQSSESDRRQPERSIASFFKQKVPDVSNACPNLEATVQVEDSDLDDDDPIMCDGDISVVETEYIEQGTTDQNSRIKPSQNVDLDFEIPSLSQLHMSQVDELPSPMRRSIMSKLNGKRSTKSGDQRQVEKNSSVKEHHLRQVDVRRMMKLASLKAGGGGPKEHSRGNISLSQLDSLPLSLQLQIANNDEMPIGKTCKAVRRDPPRRKRKSEDVEVVVVPRRDNSAAETRKKQKETNRQREDEEEVNCDSDHGNFFEDNLKPMSVFLDENDPSRADALAYLIEFLEILVSEGRFPDVVVLLRNIKKRGDEWSGETFDIIFNAVDSKARDQLGGSLDRDWIAS